MHAARPRLIALVAKALAFTVVLLVLPLFTTNAFATDYGWTGSNAPQILPDGPDHWFCFNGSVAFANIPIYASAMSYLDDATTMYDVYTGTCGTSTDIIYFEATPIYIPGLGNARGLTGCNTHSGPFGVYCDQSWVFIDPVEVFIENGGFGGNPTQYDVNINKTVRHETGHTVGLAHSTGVHAMVSGAVPLNYAYELYLGHDICHINNQVSGTPMC